MVERIGHSPPTKQRPKPTTLIFCLALASEPWSNVNSESAIIISSFEKSRVPPRKKGIGDGFVMDAPLVMHVLSVAHGFKNLTNSIVWKKYLHRARSMENHTSIIKKNTTDYSPNRIVREVYMNVSKLYVDVDNTNGLGRSFRPIFRLRAKSTHS